MRVTKLTQPAICSHRAAGHGPAALQGKGPCLVPSCPCMRAAAVQWLLGLCLGNHCATGELGQDRGNGRIVVSTHAHQRHAL